MDGLDLRYVHVGIDKGNCLCLLVGKVNFGFKFSEITKKKIEPYNSEVRWRVDDVLLGGVHWTVENIFFFVEFSGIFYPPKIRDYLFSLFD